MIKKQQQQEEECRSMRHIHRHMILIATNRDNMQYKAKKEKRPTGDRTEPIKLHRSD